MSEMQQILCCLVEIQGTVNRIEQRVDKLEKRMDNLEQRMEQRFEEIDRRFEQIDKRFEEIDRRFEQIDKRFEEIDRRFEQIDKRFEEIDRRFEEIEQRFIKYDEKLDLLEFGLETEIQKVYDVAIANQTNISILMTRWINNYSDGQTRQQVVNLSERVDVVEEVVESHSEAIFKLQHAYG